MAGVYISLGGKERELRFSFLSFKALEQHYDKPVQKVFEEEMNSGKLSDLVVIIWACLRKEKLTLGKIEELIDEAIENEEITLEELTEKLSKAINESKVVKGAAKAPEGETDPN
ncbi:hypothetical protein [Bacillus sp. 03113]|uniref:hypothetical protein n=1 Tax=Bacillus sp. 03113 TaxID=2578211 RepID=UPI0011449502|nr:hypothetical protein [Bacillus sp. 03113]